MDPVRAALLAGLLPAVVAAAVLLLAGRLGPGGARLAAGPAVAAGVIAGQYALSGLPRGLPAEAWQWIPPLAAAAGILGALEARAAGTPAPLRWGWRTALAGWGAFVSVPPGDRTAILVGGLAAGTLVLLALLDRGARGEAAAAFAPAVAAAAVGTAVALGLSGTVLLAQVAGTLAAGSGAAAALSLRRPALPAGAVLPSGVVLAALLPNGALFAELPVAAALLLAAAPLGTLLPDGLLRPLPRPWMRAGARVGAAVLLAGGAAAVAFAASPGTGY